MFLSLQDGVDDGEDSEDHDEVVVSDMESGEEEGSNEENDESQDEGQVEEKEHEEVEEEIPASQVFQESQGPVDEMQCSPTPHPEPVDGIFNDTPSPKREVASFSSALPVPESSDVVLVEETPEKEKEKKTQVWDEDVAQWVKHRDQLDDKIHEISEQLAQAKKLGASKIFGCFTFIIVFFGGTLRYK